MRYAYEYKDKNILPDNDPPTNEPRRYDVRARPELFGSVSLCYPTRSRPLTGAWIETISALSSTGRTLVAPSRGRGLKPSD